MRRHHWTTQRARQKTIEAERRPIRSTQFFHPEKFASMAMSSMANEGKIATERERQTSRPSSNVT
jgi:hypothetical protein